MRAHSGLSRATEPSTAPLTSGSSAARTPHRHDHTSQTSLEHWRPRLKDGAPLHPSRTKSLQLVKVTLRAPHGTA